MSMNNGLKTFGKVLLGVLVIVVIIGGLLLLGKAQDKKAADVQTANDITAEDHVTGKADSAVTLLEYSDFQCPTCKSFSPIIDQLITDYGDRVRFVYRHFPIYSKHQNTENAGRAAEAADKQGKFFTYGTVLFANQDEWATLPDPADKFAEYAKNLGLNEDQFRSDYKNGVSKARVTRDYNLGVSAGVQGTPTFFLDKTGIGLPQSYAAFAKLIDAELAKTAAPATDTSAETK